MKIHEYNQMMAYLTRPGRVGFSNGGDTSPVYNEKTGHIYKGGNKWGEYYSKTPPKNQFTEGMKTLDQIKKIKEANPTFRPKDLIGKGTLNNPEMGKNFKGALLTRDDIKRAEKAGLKFPTGKIVFKPTSKLISNKKYAEFIKDAQGGFISLDKLTNFSHFAPKLKSYLVSTTNTGPLKASVNRAAEGYDAAILKISQEQENLILEKPKGYKKLLLAKNKEAFETAKKFEKILPNELKGTLGYFQVSPDEKFNLKGVDRSKTFAEAKGEEKFYKNMTGAERKAFGQAQLKKINSLLKLKGASESELSNFSKAVREIQSKVGSTPVDDFMKLGIAQSKDIGNFVKKYGLGAGKLALKGIVIAAPVFAGMEVMEASEKFKKGESAGQIVADIAGNWIVPGIGEAYDAEEKNRLIKNIARPEELEALDKYNRYRSGQEMAEGAIEFGEEEAAAEQMSENVSTPKEQLNLFKLLEKGEAADFYNKQSLAAERAARPLPEIEDYYLDDLLGEDND